MAQVEVAVSSSRQLLDTVGRVAKNDDFSAIREPFLLGWYRAKSKYLGATDAAELHHIKW
jgi:hypothetical protein